MKKIIRFILQFLNFFATGYFVQEEGIRFGSPEQTFERSLEASRSKESRPPTQIGSREFFRCCKNAQCCFIVLRIIFFFSLSLSLSMGWATLALFQGHHHG